MMQRCYYKKNNSYKNYGAKGVTVCKEWREDIKSFYNWAINNGWKEGLQLDKDIKGDGLLYSPDTCCFVTHEENNRRKKSNIIYNDERMSLKEAANLAGVPYQTILLRVRGGMGVSEAIEKPIRSYISTSKKYKYQKQ